MYSEITIRWFFLLTFYFNFTNGLDIYAADELLGPTSSAKCSAEDECITLNNCKGYMDFIKNSEKPLKPSIVAFLRDKHCGFDQGHPKVCCKLDLGNTVFTISAPKLDYESCPMEGACVPLEDCKPYTDLVNMLEKPLNLLVVKFLRSQQCGFRDGSPTVCCSVVPENIKASILHTKPHTSKKPNSLSTNSDIKNNVDGHKARLNPPKSAGGGRSNKEKADAINKAFDLADFFDFAGPFDLLRKKRFNSENKVNVEIR